MGADGSRSPTNAQHLRTVTRFSTPFIEVCKVDSHVSRRFPTIHLKNRRTFALFTNRVKESLNIDLLTAKQVVQDLYTEEYIEPSERGNKYWHTTMKGNTLANATARKPITRRTAERLVKDFLNRVKEINACDDYLYCVKQVILFGSYLSSSSTLGDIDLSIILEFRYDDPDMQDKQRQERIRLAQEEGRNFQTLVDKLSWPWLEVLRFLKGRSPSLSLHDEASEKILSRSIPSRILFPESETH